MGRKGDLRIPFSNTRVNFICTNKLWGPETFSKPWLCISGNVDMCKYFILWFHTVYDGKLEEFSWRYRNVIKCILNS
jgi:hypothetical protein